MNPKADILDAIAIAAETVPMPTVREMPALRCQHVGCDNLAARSDKRCARHSKFMPVGTDLVSYVDERLKSFTPEAADLMIEAARAGAPNGDHKAALAILTHSGVVKPVGPAQATPSQGSGLIVNVGIVLPGLPGSDL